MRCDNVWRNIRENRQDWIIVFMDLEKACERVPRQKGVPEKYVNYSTRYVRRSDNSGKKQCMIDGQDPSECMATPKIFPDPVPFPIIMDVSACRIKDLSPWCMLYADDIVLCGTIREEVEKKLEEWRRAMDDRERDEDQYRKKTVYLRFNGDRNFDGNSDINPQAGNLERLNTFNYLGTTFADNGDLGADMTHIQSGWKNWKRVSEILCDRGIRLRVKGKVHKTDVRPAMVYSAETWAVKKAHEKKLDVAEMRMLMSGVTKLDRIRNERIRGTTKVGEISKEVG